MTDADDRALREALEAEAGDVEATPELLARIRDAAAAAHGRAHRPRRRVAVVAAAIVVAAGTVVAIVQRDGDETQRVELSDDSATPDIEAPDIDTDRCRSGVDLTVHVRDDLTRAEGAELDAWMEADDRFSGTYDRRELRGGVLPDGRPMALLAPYPIDVHDPAQIPAVRADLADRPEIDRVVDHGCESAVRPNRVALVRSDGWLVLIDLDSGDERELVTAGDPDDPDRRTGIASFIDAVELSPDGQMIYYSTCCEPADGNTYRLRAPFTDDPELFASGSYPRLSPDGRFVATAAGPNVLVTSTDGGAPPAIFQTAGAFLRHLAWSPMGDEVAFAIDTDDVPPFQIRSLRWDGEELTPVDPGKPDNPGVFPAWDTRGSLHLMDGQPVADDLGLSQDASYRWLLWIDEDGTPRAQAGFSSGDRTPIPGLPKAIAADW